MVASEVLEPLLATMFFCISFLLMWFLTLLHVIIEFVYDPYVYYVILVVQLLILTSKSLKY